MNMDATHSEGIPKRFNASILVGLFSIIVFGLAGAVCPVMADMLVDFGFESLFTLARL